MTSKDNQLRDVEPEHPWAYGWQSEYLKKLCQLKYWRGFRHGMIVMGLLWVGSLILIGLLSVK